MVFFVRITVNQSHLRSICKSTKFNPKIQRTIYLINFQQLRLHVPDFIRTVVIAEILCPPLAFKDTYVERISSSIFLSLHLSNKNPIITFLLFLI